MRRVVVSVTTASDGTATAYSPPVSGSLHSVAYVKDGTTPYTNGVDFTITNETTAEGIWTEADVNASTVRYPRAATHTNAGVAALYAAGGTAVNGLMALARSRIKIVLAQGGATKTGAFHFMIG